MKIYFRAIHSLRRFDRKRRRPRARLARLVSHPIWSDGVLDDVAYKAAVVGGFVHLASPVT